MAIALPPYVPVCRPLAPPLEGGHLVVRMNHPRLSYTALGNSSFIFSSLCALRLFLCFGGPLKGFPYAFLLGFCVEVSFLSVGRGTRLRLVSWKIGRGGADFSCSDVRLGPYYRVLGVRGFPMRGCRVVVGFCLRLIFGCMRVLVP